MKKVELVTCWLGSGVFLGCTFLLLLYLDPEVREKL